MLTDRDRDKVMRFHPLTYLSDQGEVIVGRVDTDSYGLFPPDGAALIERLASGASLQDAQVWYEDTYGEPVDIADFLDTLDELAFLDHGSPTEVPAGDGARRVRWQRTGTALFSPVAWIFYAGIVLATVIACATHPTLRPQRDNVFFSHYLLVVELIVAFGQVPLIFIHELFHVLAGRRLGLNSRVRIGRRLYFVVFETIMDGLVVVPRRRRYLPMLAGMLADLLLMCALTLAAWALLAPDGSLSIASGVCLALAFTTFMRWAMEFFLFLRTDIYYLAATLTGCIDLHQTSSEMVRNKLWHLCGRSERKSDPARWHPNDMRSARWYAPLFVLGYVVATVMFVLVLFPISWHFLTTAIVTAAHGDIRSPAFWDATGLLAMNGAQPAVAGLIKLQEKARQRRTARRTPMWNTEPALEAPVP